MNASRLFVYPSRASILRAACAAWLATLALLASADEALAPVRPGRTLRFENLVNRQSSVPANSVLALLQDKQGFIWMGTQGMGQGLETSFTQLA